MIAGPTLRRQFSEQLARLAVRHMRARHPEWADALAAEGEAVDERDQLRWAVGCAVASLRVSGAADVAAYPAALAAGVLALTAYQWSADESVFTIGLVSLLGLALGLLEPRRVLMSGLAVGVVVAGVNAFETITGVLPAYEAERHTLIHDLRWTLLAAPALLTAIAGRAVALRLTSPLRT